MRWTAAVLCVLLGATAWAVEGGPSQEEPANANGAATKNTPAKKDIKAEKKAAKKAGKDNGRKTEGTPRTDVTQMAPKNPEGATPKAHEEKVDQGPQGGERQGAHTQTLQAPGQVNGTGLNGRIPNREGAPPQADLVVYQNGEQTTAIDTHTNAAVNELQSYPTSVQLNGPAGMSCTITYRIREEDREIEGKQASANYFTFQPPGPATPDCESGVLTIQPGGRKIKIVGKACSEIVKQQASRIHALESDKRWGRAREIGICLFLLLTSITAVFVVRQKAIAALGADAAQLDELSNRVRGIRTELQKVLTARGPERSSPARPTTPDPAVERVRGEIRAFVHALERWSSCLTVEPGQIGPMKQTLAKAGEEIQSIEDAQRVRSEFEDRAISICKLAVSATPIDRIKSQAQLRLEDLVKAAGGELSLIQPRPGEDYDGKVHDFETGARTSTSASRIGEVTRWGLKAGGRVQITARVTAL